MNYIKSQNWKQSKCPSTGEHYSITQPLLKSDISKGVKNSDIYKKDDANGKGSKYINTVVL